MTKLIKKNTPVMVQGITGHAAAFHTKLMKQYGTNVVSGVRPGVRGIEVHGVPVFPTVEEAVHNTHPEVGILFVPAKVMKTAAFEAIEAGIPLLVLVSEHVPLHDTLQIIDFACRHNVSIIGPNTPGLIAPPLKCKIGFVPSQYYTPGPLAVASRSGTLTYEIVSRLTLAGLGQQICVGVGGDAVVGTTFAQLAISFEEDPKVEAMLFIGEVGGGMEEQVADLVCQNKIKKPVVAYLAGRTAPEGKRMGHAGAIVSGGRGSMKAKLAAFNKAGIPVASLPEHVLPLVRHALGII